MAPCNTICGGVLVVLVLIVTAILGRTTPSTSDTAPAVSASQRQRQRQRLPAVFPVDAASVFKSSSQASAPVPDRCWASEGDTACALAVVRRILSWTASTRLSSKEKFHENCANIAIPGTGSGTLTALMQQQGTTYAHHLHSYTVGMLQAKTRGNVTCFLVTLRDPVARLESGFEYMKMLRDFSSFDELVAKAKHYAEENHSDTSSEGAYRWLFVSQSHAKYDAFNTMFKRYLQPLVSEHNLDIHVHVLCTETLSQGISRLWSRFNLPPPARSHVNARVVKSRNRTDNQLQSHDLERWLRSAAPRIREDSLLHRLFCGWNAKSRNS